MPWCVARSGLSAKAAGLSLTLTQVGYTLGLLFVVPLGDLLENRRLIVTALLVTATATATALVVAALSSGAVVFLAAALVIGLGSVAAQVIVPFAAHLSQEATQGQTVGKVVSGLLLGIMLARPVASLVAAHASWHVVFGGAAVLMVLLALALVLRRASPVRQPVSNMRYPALMASLWHLLLGTPVLRRRATYHAGLFGAFSLFWTVTPVVLASPAFGLSQTGIAIFALVGMAGAIASPAAWTMQATLCRPRPPRWRWASSRLPCRCLRRNRNTWRWACWCWLPSCSTWAWRRISCWASAPSSAWARKCGVA